jgi:hypothetical protein
MNQRFGPIEMHHSIDGVSLFWFHSFEQATAHH